MEQENSQRVIIPISQKLINTIDDFRFKNRIASRAEAIRLLIGAGLEASAQKEAATD